MRAEDVGDAIKFFLLFFFGLGIPTGIITAIVLNWDEIKEPFVRMGDGLMGIGWINSWMTGVRFCSDILLYGIGIVVTLFVFVKFLSFLWHIGD